MKRIIIGFVAALSVLLLAGCNFIPPSATEVYESESVLLPDGSSARTYALLDEDWGFYDNVEDSEFKACKKDFGQCIGYCKGESVFGGSYTLLFYQLNSTDDFIAAKFTDEKDIELYRKTSTMNQEIDLPAYAGRNSRWYPAEE